jgi:hypothetical protein
MEPAGFNHLLVETRICSRISGKCMVFYVYFISFFFAQLELKLRSSITVIEMHLTVIGDAVTVPLPELNFSFAKVILVY